MSSPKPSKVLRVVAIVDGESCEELHQTSAGDIFIERAGSSLSVGPSLELETGVAAEGDPRERTLPRVLMLIGALLIVFGGGLFAREVSQHVLENAVLTAADATQVDEASDPTSTIALSVALFGVIPLVIGASMLRGRRRRGREQITVYDGWAAPKDYRKRAPVWLGVGAVLIVGGGSLFAYEVGSKDTSVEITDSRRGDMSAFRPGEQQGTGGLGLAIALLGIVPLVVGLVGIREEPVRPRKRPPKGAAAPRRHKLFDWVESEGTYYIDIPAETRGKIALGKSKTTVEQLRKRFGEAGRLRVKLGPKAKGKLLIGQTKILFQTAKPAREPVKPAFPTEYVDPLVHLRPTSLDAASFGAAAGIAVLLGVWFAYFADRTPTPPAARFLHAAGTASLYEDKEEDDEPEEAEEDVLLAKDETKEEKKEDKQVDDDKLVKPENISQAAFNEARGVGVARVLGTWGGPGEGSVLDIIESTENNLGELFAMGMTSTVEYHGGEIGEFVAGGGGINATGTIASNAGLQTGEGPAEVGGTDKKERKVKGTATSSGTDVFGDIDKKAVTATIRQRMQGLQACYEKALRSNPSLKGKMTYTITINTSGRVTHVNVEEDTINDASVKSCTIGKIKAWRFFSEGAEDSSEVTFSVNYTG